MMVKVMMVLNVVLTFVPAFLVTASLERFEVLSHEVEYCNDTMQHGSGFGSDRTPLKHMAQHIKLTNQWTMDSGADHGFGDRTPVQI